MELFFVLFPANNGQNTTCFSLLLSFVFFFFLFRWCYVRNRGYKKGLKL